jgi:glycine/D-amino acid oxidase-like deaminating enzyme
VENVYVATAFAAIGLQLGPFSGKLAADWAQAIQPSVDTSLFSPERFQRQD